MSEQGPPAPLTARSLALATLAALVIAGLALTVYILPANYGLDPTGAGKAIGVEGQPPSQAADEGSPAPPAPNASLDGLELRRFEASWPTTSEAGPETEGYTAENETTTVDLALPAVNLTEATVTISWTDDNETAGQSTEPDELELVLEAPDGTTTEPVRAANGDDGEGELSTTLDLTSPPDNATIHAPNATAARSHPAATASQATSEGAWKAHITVVEAGDAEATDTPLGDDPAGDEGTDWTLTSSTRSYQLALADAGPADVRTDEHTFELPPGEGMEHKVTLEANATLAYAWRTSSEVYVDFHAEPADDTGFTSFGTGTTDTATGLHVAPFTGTHGWYWENRGDQPIAITVVTAGTYTDGFTR